MAEDWMDVDESMDVDIGGPEPEVPKKRRVVKEQFKKTVFFPPPAKSSDGILIPFRPEELQEKRDPTAFPMDMINQIVENSKKIAESARVALQAERDRIEKERAVAQREALKKEEAEIQEKIVQVRKLLTEKEAAAKAAGDTPERPSTPGLNSSVDSTSAPSLSSTISDLQQELINLRVKMQQIKFAEHERRENQRKIQMIWEIHPHLTEEEALRSLKDCGGDEEEVITKFTEWSYLHELRLKIAQEKTPPEEMEDDGKKKKRGAKKAGGTTVRAKRASGAKKASTGGPTDASGASASVSGAPTNADGASDNNTTAAAAGAGGATTADGAAAATAATSGVSEDSDGEGDLETRSHKKKKKVQVPKLRLDDAVAQATQQGSMDGWSQARIRAWKLRDSNPNAYYYRFNDPGEEQRNGKWSEDEKKAFFKRMAEVGVNGQWGIFAKAIHGRVGYQCANFYRQLIESGEIQDERYVIDETGKAHFLFSKGIIKKGKNKDGSEAPSGEVTAENVVVGADGQPLMSPEAKPPPKKKRKIDTDGAAGTTAQEASTAAAASSSSKKTSSAKKSAAAKAKTSQEDGEPSNGDSMQGIVSSSAGGDAAVAETTPKKKRAPAAKKAAGGAGAKKAAANKKKRKKANDDNDDDADDDYKPSSKTADALNEEVEAKKAKMREENPLPDMRDAITQEELLQPALSPYGHVLSYATWMTILLKDPKNTCPFTKQPLKKRDLVLLTWDNIDEYQDKIIRPE